MASRQDIEASARKFLHRKWIDKGRGPGGHDCIGLIVLVARDLGLVAPDFDVNGYGRQTDPEALLAEARRHLVEINPLRAARGDVVFLRDQINPTHSAILTEAHGLPHMVHASLGARQTIEEVFDKDWRRRVTHAFQFPGLET